MPELLETKLLHPQAQKTAVLAIDVGGTGIKWGLVGVNPTLHYVCAGEQTTEQTLRASAALLDKATLERTADKVIAAGLEGIMASRVPNP